MEHTPIKIAVIGGSGLYQMDTLAAVREVRMTTPYGDPSDALIIGELKGTPVVFLPRHGRGHIHLPSDVPYRANIYALKQLGVQHIISVSACGSLREHLAPGHIVIPNQLFDFTKNRARTFFEQGLIAHVSSADPFCGALSTTLADACREAGGTIHEGGAFITIEGPRFSTKAESHAFRAWGMDLIGMTTSPEAFLAREAGMCYAVMAHVTDYDVWHESEEPVTVDMVIERLHANLALAQRALTRLIPQLGHTEPACECTESLAQAILTARDCIPAAVCDKLRVIVGDAL